MVYTHKQSQANLHHAHVLTAILADWFPTSFDSPGPEALTLAYLGRCRNLLSAMVVLIESGQDEAACVVHRTLLENYIVGLYVALGGHDAINALTDADIVSTNQLKQALGRPPSNADKGRQLFLSDYTKKDGIVQRVEALLRDDDPKAAKWVREAYTHNYKVLSHHFSHGNLAALDGYAESIDDQVVIQSGPNRSAEATHLLNLAIGMVLGLASGCAKLLSLEIAPLVDVARAWSDSANPDQTSG